MTPNWYGMGVQFMSKGAGSLLGTFRALETQTTRWQTTFDKSATAIEKRTDKLNQRMMKASMQLMGAAMAAGALFYGPGKLYAGFESAMVQIEYLSGKTGKNLETYSNNLRKYITDVGILTQFNPQEIADTVAIISQAGFDKEAQIKSLMPAITRTSTMSRGKLGLEESTELTIVAARKFAPQFKVMEEAQKRYISMAERATYVTDMMAAAANAGSLNIEEMPELMRSMGAASSQFSTTNLGELLALTDALKDYGMTIADSGQAMTGFGRRIGILMRTLGKAPKKKTDPASMQGVLKTLGITMETFADKATGKMRALPEIIRDVTAKVKGQGWGTAKQQAVLEQLFTSVGAKMFVAAAAKGPGGLESMAANLNQTGPGEGARSEEARKRDPQYLLKLMKGSWETMQMLFFASFGPSFVWFVEKLTAAMNIIIRFEQRHPKIVGFIGKLIAGGLMIVALKAGFTLIGLFMTKMWLLGMRIGVQWGLWILKWVMLKPAIFAAKAMMWLFNAATMANPAGAIILGIIVGIAALGAALRWITGNWTALGEVMGAAMEYAVGKIANAWLWIKKAFAVGTEWVANKFRKDSEKVDLNALAATYDVQRVDTDKLWKNVQEAAYKENFTNLGDLLKSDWKKLKTKMGGLLLSPEASMATPDEIMPDYVEPPVEDLSNALGTNTGALQDNTKALKENWQKLLGERLRGQQEYLSRVGYAFARTSSGGVSMAGAGGRGVSVKVANINVYGDASAKDIEVGVANGVARALTTSAEDDVYSDEGEE